MKHIDKMARAICCPNGCETHSGVCEKVMIVDYVATAQAAFDALIAAVPDLVWKDHDGAYISDRPVDTSRYVIRQHPNDSDWAIAPEDSCVFLYFDTLDKAKAWANNHRRAQARDIWEG